MANELISWDASQLDLIKDQVAPGLTDGELAVFVEFCKGTGLNPFMRQVYAITRGEDGKRKVTYQTGIDGFRSIADRTGQYAGSQTFWLVEVTEGNFQWFDFWFPGLGKGKTPLAARTHIYKKGCEQPFVAVARFDAYAQKKKYDGSLTEMWTKMPDVMIAKCSEALALRKAFPAQLGSIYETTEMQQADNKTYDASFEDHTPPVKPKKAEPAAQTVLPIDYVGKFRTIIQARSEQNKPSIEVLSDIVATPLNEGELMALYAKFKTIKSPEDLDVFVAYANEVLDAAAKRTTTTSNDFPL